MDLVDADLIDLLKAIKPHLGQEALRYAEAAEAMLAVLASQPAQRASLAFKALRPSGAGLHPLPVPLASGEGAEGHHD